MNERMSRKQLSMDIVSVVSTYGKILLQHESWYAQYEIMRESDQRDRITLLGWCTGFEPSIAVFERQKVAKVLKRENNVIGGKVQI